MFLAEKFERGYTELVGKILGFDAGKNTLPFKYHRLRAITLDTTIKKTPKGDSGGYSSYIYAVQGTPDKSSPDVISSYIQVIIKTNHLCVLTGYRRCWKWLSAYFTHISAWLNKSCCSLNNSGIPISRMVLYIPVGQRVCGEGEGVTPLISSCSRDKK